MADFGDFSTNEFNAGDFEVEDPTADFLARERAILGEDADFIATTGDGVAPPSGTFQPEDALFGFEEVKADVTSAQQIPLPTSTSSRYQTSFDSNTQLNQFDTTSFENTSSYQAPHSGSQSYQSTPVSHSFSAGNYQAPTSQGSVFAAPEADSEFIRNWRSQFQDRLGDRDRREKEKHQQILADAQAELQKFQSEYESKRIAKIQEKGRITSNSNDGRDGKSGWDLVQHMISPVSGSLQSGNGLAKSPQITAGTTSKDTSRLRSLIQDLAISNVTPRIKGQ